MSEDTNWYKAILSNLQDMAQWLDERECLDNEDIRQHVTATMNAVDTYIRERECVIATVRVVQTHVYYVNVKCNLNDTWRDAEQAAISYVEDGYSDDPEETEYDADEQERVPYDEDSYDTEVL